MIRLIGMTRSMLRRLGARLGFRRRGRILAVKWGMNPNSSSLGVDVTFLLFGMAAVALLTPIIALLLRARRVLRGGDDGAAGGRPPARSACGGGVFPPARPRHAASAAPGRP